MKLPMCLNAYSGYMMRFHDHCFSSNTTGSVRGRSGAFFLCEKWQRQTESFYEYSNKISVKVDIYVKQLY